MNNEIGKTFSSSVTAASLAAIISVTPIVSIAGSTLSEITTTTTSTTTTPTPTSSEPIKAADDDLPANPMSDAAAKTTAGGGAAASGNVTGALKKESTPHSDEKSESWEESRLKDWDDIRLKKLLEEAYSYKNPRDKANKSDIFLELLQKAENEKEDQTFFHALTSRYTRNSSSSTTSNSHHHHHHHHHHKQGGSLQDLVDPVRFEPLLDCDFVGGGHRNRRHNHNSRQKKYSSVSSRQREGGSLPSNVNVTNCGGLLGGGTLEQPPFMHEVKTGINSKQQRRNAKGATAVSVKETEQESAGVGSANCNDIATGTVGGISSTCGPSGDCVIEIGEPMMDIQQQMHTLQSKSQDPATQGLPFYDRLDSIDVRIPRANISHSLQSKTDFAPSSAQCYVDETVRFTTMERSAILGANVGAACIGAHVGSVKASSTIDSNYLPLDENYKSCKSVLGGEKSEMSKTPATMFSTTKTITTYSNISSLPQRQYDENGNSLNEIYQTGAQAAIMNASAGGVNASASCSASVNSGQSQAKAKSKKKSQQDRNTKTVDVESVAGYRGKDPVEVLVKYIESSEDKQNDSKSNSSKFNENSKKKDRKKDKEKQHKLKKKSNSLEELRSCSKIDVDDLKRTAATTESNVMMRNKGGGNGHKSNSNKNNSSSTADINKNFENANVKELPTSTTATVAVAVGVGTAAGVGIKAITTNSVATNRKGERRSWGTEELQYLGETNTSNDEKAKEKKSNKIKEKEKELDKEIKEAKDPKEKVSSSEKNEKNSIMAAEIISTPPTKVEKSERPEKLEKVEKRKKSESSSSSAPVTIVDILAMDSLVPETAEFHVVTKKRKPKKQRASLDETSSSGGNSVTVVSFNRTHNFITNMPKSTSATFGQQQQQQQQPYRYKYYNSHAGATNNEQRGVEYIGNYHNSNNNYNSNNYSHGTNHHYHHDGPHHNHQHVASSGDKSRRKSTSSVPPSEKSDSSDLDSVHSLPIESSKKQRHKNTAASQSTSNSNKNVANNNSPAPISYADIARTNKELAAAADSNGSGADKWPPVDAANCNSAAVDSSVSITDETQMSNAAAQMVVGAASNPAKVKVKKTASKPDFPELVAAATAVVSAPIPIPLEIVTVKMNAFKPISYSQSLTTVPPPMAIAAVATVTSSISDVTPAPATAATEMVEIESKPTDKRYPASEVAKAESVICNNAFGGARQQQLHQHQHQQQPLQKSKSVEHESYNYNSTNLDQQYPALEKTVKRHSATNVAIAIATNTTTTTAAPASIVTPPATAAQFNFAAAAKQQTNAYGDIPAKSASTPATTTTSGNQATVVTAPGIPNTSPNAVVVRKSKEKSPNPTVHSNSVSLVGSDILANNPQSNPGTNAVVMRKSKKEKLQQMHADSSAPTESQKFSTATQTNATSISNKVRSQASSASANNVTATIACKAINAVSNKNNKMNVTAQATTNHKSTTGTTASANRPAVIILNFDRAIGASNDFTFGDFNEEELKFFDDDIADGEVMADALDVAYEDEDDVGVDYVDIDDDEDDDEPQHFSFPLPSATAAKSKLSPHAATAATTAAATFFNDSGASSDVVNNSTQHSEDIMLLSSADASSPNTSFVAVSHGGNQSSDSGIYTTSNKSKSNNSNTSNTSSKRPSPGKEAANKLNSFLNTPTLSSAPAAAAAAETTTTLTEQSTSGSSKSCPPPQQLETCNDIETAIIAAARAAAEQQQQQKQYQNQKKSNSSSNSSSFSSSSSVSVDAKYPPQSQSPSATTKASANHYSHAHERRQSHPYDEEVDEQTSRSRSHSRQRGVAPPASLVVNIQRKEFDIHFIPPTMSTAFSSLQHNEIIVDFIGSAWEEVANSKVTKFYDGQ